ncbi:MAG: phosphotransferase [Deltaproteobacteria bacterium]|nr:phosphotransferase [Deltaproteobacteria bacterium]
MTHPAYDPRADLCRLAAERLGGQPVKPEQLEKMKGGGSDRHFYRFPAGQPLVGVWGEDPAENQAFWVFTRHFAARGIPVPKLFGEDPVRGLYLMEDLGAHTLQEQLRLWRKEETPGRVLAALERVVDWLAVIQVAGGRGLDEGLFYQGRVLDRARFQADVDYFLAQYAGRYFPLLPPTPQVTAGLTALVDRVAAEDATHFCYRDFQTRNIMWPSDDRGPVFIDYQSGRWGPLAYDLVSLLFSPDSGLDEAGRETLTERYLAALATQGAPQQGDTFRQRLMDFVLIRRMQALGAYAYLAHVKHKPLLLEKIPGTLALLRGLLARPEVLAGEPELKTWLARLVAQAPEEALRGMVL